LGDSSSKNQALHSIYKAGTGLRFEMDQTNTSQEAHNLKCTFTIQAGAEVTPLSPKLTSN